MVVGIQFKAVFTIVYLHHRFAFSRNGQPTIVPIPNPNVTIGRARQMSATDILRVNRLYNCSTYLFTYVAYCPPSFHACMRAYKHIYLIF